MGQVRDAIAADQFPEYIKSFFRSYFGSSGYPRWAVDALRSVSVDLTQDGNVPIVEGDGAKWEYSTQDNR